MLNNGCNDFLFGVHYVEEGDRIPLLQSYGQALKQKGNRVEHVCACQLRILGNLVLCRLMSCRPWGGHCVSDV